MFWGNKGAEMKNKITLPNKPSELIRLALHDLELCEKDKRYLIDMDDWHINDTSDLCCVCLAGSVMAKSLKANFYATLGPEIYNKSTKLKLFALDDFRTGDIRDGVEILFRITKNSQVDLPPDRDICDYDKDPNKFKRDMRKLANEFESVGL